MKKSRNRVTPILVIILIVLIWVLFACIIYKLTKNGTIGVKRLKLEDDLVQELYSYTTDDDILLYSKSGYNIESLPSEYIFSKATRFMTLEDVELNDVTKQFSITQECLDSAIKTAFGPDFKAELKNIDASVKTDFELNEHKLLFKIKYDSSTNSYVGTYSEITTNDNILVTKKLLAATKSKTVNLRIGYYFYKFDTNYKICNDSKCDSIVEEVNSLDDLKYDKYITVSLKKASDEVYYYDSNK